MEKWNDGIMGSNRKRTSELHFSLLLSSLKPTIPPFHRSIIPFLQMILMNRKAGLNLLLNAASEAVQQWSREIQGMRMGLLIVAHKGEWNSGIVE